MATNTHAAMRNDTIVAIATPEGVGGIAILRISGPDTEEIVTPLLAPRTPLPRRRPSLRRIADIDEGLVTLFPAPHSYTGETTIEIACHGSAYIQQALLNALIDAGARWAEPGEFTRRAFTGGRLNLAQAEAIADLIDASTPVQHQLAVSQLRGGYATELKELRKELVDLTALMELELDFSQEDVEFADRKQLGDTVEKLTHRIETLTHSFRIGNALKRGVTVAIVGKPNAGKSSLLNALVGEKRAIVSNIPGTTRDTVEELISIQGVPFRIIDTAGLRHTDDPVETEGVVRSQQAAAQADIIIHLHDATTPFDPSESNYYEASPQSKRLLVYSKCDLPNAAPPPDTLAISSTTGTGLDQLQAAMVEGYSQTSGNVTLSNARHYNALIQVNRSLQQVTSGLEIGLPADLLAVDLRDALYHLGTITGEVTSNELLHSIFSRFCIGK